MLSLRISACVFVEPFMCEMHNCEFLRFETLSSDDSFFAFFVSRYKAVVLLAFSSGTVHYWTQLSSFEIFAPFRCEIISLRELDP